MNDIARDEVSSILDSLSGPNQKFARRYPGEPPERQPVHVVYGGAQLFRADIASHLGAQALAALDEYAPDPLTFARAIGLADLSKKQEKAIAKRSPEELRAEDPAAWLATSVYTRVREKLAREPVEDFRIDFEDGFGVRPDDEEDRAAINAAEEAASAHAAGMLPPFIGIRIKPLNEEMKRRSVRTLDLFFSTLAERTVGRMPSSMIVTLPKVPIPEQVTALARLLDRLESKIGIAPRSIRIELMIELTQSVFDAEGRLNLIHLLDAGEGRVVGAHFGTYDYTASCGITANHQTMAHPACQLALGLIKIGCAYSGVFLSDGATNILPVPIHRGEKLKRREREENARSVHGAWALAYKHTMQSLENAYYQGWDVHPAQLPVRYAATYAFFLRSFDAAAARLRNFVEKAAQATLVGEVFDDAATGQGLLNYFLRALNCGAVTLEELSATGLTQEEIATRSFKKILEARTNASRS